MARNLLDLHVRCAPSAPAIVRSAISDLDGVDAPVLEDAKLVASELVTNAVTHSLCSEEEFLTVRIGRDGGVEISVLDPGRSARSAEIAHRAMGLGGLGLRVVAQLAETWGTKRRPDGYEVFAVLELAS